MKPYIIIYTVLGILSSCQNNESDDISQQTFNCDSLPSNIAENENLYRELLARQPDSSQLPCLLKVANNFNHLGADEYFFNASKTLLNLSEAYNNAITAKSYFNLAVYFEQNKHHDSSFYYLLQAENIFKRVGTDLQLATVYNSQARILIYFNDIIAAENYATKALLHSQKIDDKTQIFTSYVLLGISASVLEDYSVAMTYHQKALLLVRRYDIENDFENECLTLNNLGNVYQEQHNYTTATNYYMEALSHNKINTISKDVYARLLGNYGYTLLKLRNPNSYKYLNRSLIIYDSLGSPDIVDTQINLSEYFMERGDTMAAIAIGKQALRGARIHNSSLDLIRALNQLSLYDSSNEIMYLRELVKVSDSVNLAERLARNKFARLQYETDELSIEKEKADKQKWIAISLAAAIIIIIGLLLVIQIQRTRAKELKLVQNQQKANEEIFSLIIQQQEKIDEGREKERKRISEDLHDGVMNRLASTRLNLFILNKKTDIETIKKCLKYISEIQDIEKEIRSIAHDLNTEVFRSDSNFYTLLQELIIEQKNVSNASWNVAIDKTIEWDNLSITAKVNIYRILQEVLSNINKHSKANFASIQILTRLNTIVIDIRDNGIGFNSNDSFQGIGLSNVESRIKSLGANFVITTMPFQGTKIKLTIPI